MTWTVPSNETLRLPDFLSWDMWPFEGDVRVKPLAAPVVPEPPRSGDPGGEPCVVCAKPASAYIWQNDNWRLGPYGDRGGLPVVLLLDSRRHVDLGDLSDAEAAEFGMVIVRIERAIMSLGGIARVHVARYGDGCAHLHVWFFARPEGMLQFRGTLASLWDDCLPPVPDDLWNDNLGGSPPRSTHNRLVQFDPGPGSSRCDTYGISHGTHRFDPGPGSNQKQCAGGACLQWPMPGGSARTS